ncbi:MAG: hypothetical protein WBC21_03305 [Minisyncoccales bacterium]
MLRKIILIIIIAGVFIGWAEFYLWKKQTQPPIEPKQSEFDKLTYFNEIYGYSLKIPKEWKDKYEIREEEKTTSFVYNVVPSPFSEGENLIFSITVYSKNEWEEIEKERKEVEEKGLAPGCCPTVFAEKNGTVFVYNISISNPYDSPEIADEFQKMAGQVKEIIASFSLTE